MYVTPAIKTVAMTTEASSCCHFYFNSESVAIRPISNPACGPIGQFPTCGINPAFGTFDTPAAPSLCVITVATPVGTLTASGR